MTSTSKSAQPFIARQQAELRDRLPFSDAQDLEDATRGLIARRVPGTVTGEDGGTVWDSGTFAFLEGDAPDTVNPSLWRQSKLVAEQGLFEVVEGIYQVRGLDLSNVTFVEGTGGVLVIDPLISTETAAAALALYREYRGDRPVTGVLYTHSHVDHFGGVKGVTTQQDVDAGRVPVIAPEGFTEHAVAENVYAGTAMGRRAAYMYGAALARGPRGAVGAGLGQTTSTGKVTLIPPTVTVTGTGQEEVVDGIRMVFQMAPNTEAPAELLVHFPNFPSSPPEARPSRVG
ncbi:Putative alkyl_aryl-sulfatase YjcS [Streptomyces sp. enrichment culture]